ncbi:5-formyltetrahydrofolate cyclo-ligase [Tepidibacillus sp. LV47]|uniref:5-formyltetrahydrofolate cyclo-ligase n=1 Tax=Tepidibacillus sp. LV47 TaxID=3398228 RepID=UPI003AAEA439
MERTKKNLRQFFLEKRNQLDSFTVKEKSEKINQNLLTHPLYQLSQRVMVYLSFKNEVDLKGLIEHAWKQGKQVIAPKTNSKTKQIDPYLIRSWSELEKGILGILEPKTCDKNPFPLKEIELVLVPGLAFDYQGYRLGYGGGYYDRFFDRFAKPPYRIGIAYDFQRVPHLPRDDHDYPVDEICTEKGCFKL